MHFSLFAIYAIDNYREFHMPARMEMLIGFR